MKIVILSLFFVIYYGKSLSCLHEKISDVFGLWDTNLRHHVIPLTRQEHGKDIVDTVNYIFRHKFMTIYVFGTPMNSLQKRWLRRCSGTIFPHGVLAWGSDLNFMPVSRSSVVISGGCVTDILDGIYDNSPLSKMVMFLPLAANSTFT